MLRFAYSRLCWRRCYCPTCPFAPNLSHVAEVAEMIAFIHASMRGICFGARHVDAA